MARGRMATHRQSGDVAGKREQDEHPAGPAPASTAPPTRRGAAVAPAAQPTFGNPITVPIATPASRAPWRAELVADRRRRRLATRERLRTDQPARRIPDPRRRPRSHRIRRDRLPIRRDHLADQGAPAREHCRHALPARGRRRRRRCRTSHPPGVDHRPVRATQQPLPDRLGVNGRDRAAAVAELTTISSICRTQRPVGDCARVRRRLHPIVANWQTVRIDVDRSFARRRLTPTLHCRIRGPDRPASSSCEPPVRRCLAG
jgi:hypothetical protein